MKQQESGIVLIDSVHFFLFLNGMYFISFTNIASYYKGNLMEESSFDIWGIWNDTNRTRH